MGPAGSRHVRERRACAHLGRTRGPEMSRPFYALTSDEGPLTIAVVGWVGGAGIMLQDVVGEIVIRGRDVLAADEGKWGYPEIIMASWEQLRERWETDDGRRRLAKVIEAAKKKEDWAAILKGFPYVEEVYNGRDLRFANLSGANLIGAYLRADLSGADLSGADLSEANLSHAALGRANLNGAHLIDANLSHAALDRANLSGASLINADLYCANLPSGNLQDANLKWCDLTQSVLNNATLTGAKLYGTARDDWSIKGIKCDYVYLDGFGEKRSPADRNLEPGEFERLYASVPGFEYVFEHGMTPMDLVVMDRVVQAIREKHPELDLKIATADVRGANPTVKLTVQLEEHKDPAQELLKANFQAKVAELEAVGAERDRVYGLVHRLIEAPKDVRIVEDPPPRAGRAISTIIYLAFVLLAFFVPKQWTPTLAKRFLVQGGVIMIGLSVVAALSFGRKTLGAILFVVAILGLLVALYSALSATVPA